MGELEVTDEGGSASSIAAWRLIPLKSPKSSNPVTSEDEFIRDLSKSPLIQRAIVPGATLSLYGYKSAGAPPSFATFLAAFDKLKLPAIPIYAYVLIIRMDAAAMPWYAMPFGVGGRYLLIEDAPDLDASRQIAKQLTIPDDPTSSAQIRQLGTTLISSRPMRSQKRATGVAPLEDFQFDRYSEILNEIDAKPADREKYGSSVRGGQGIGLSKRITLEQLPQRVTLFEDAKTAAVAKVALGDAMHQVKDAALIGRLDDALAAAVRDADNDDVTFSIPDFIYADEWATMKLTQLGKTAPLTDDLDMGAYRHLLGSAGKLDSLDVAYLKHAEAHVGAERPYKQFRIYNCLSAAVAIDGRTYVHHVGDWYAIPSDILEYIDGQVDLIEPWRKGLENQAARIDEPTFNRTHGERFLYLDTATAAAVAGQKPIEICDLLTIDDECLTLVHVKRDFKSATLSHLFNQGRASALMMLETGPRARFRERIMAPLAATTPKPRWSRKLQGFLSDPGFRPAKTRVVYAILGPWSGKTPSKRLPFMSKLNLASAARELRGRQFDVRIAAIEMPGS